MDNKEKEILGKYQFWKNNPQQPNYGDEKINICMSCNCGGCGGQGCSGCGGCGH